jgi:uncharacterized protein (TIGR02246 family)
VLSRLGDVGLIPAIRTGQEGRRPAHWHTELGEQLRHWRAGPRVAARPVNVRFLTGDTAIMVSEDGIIFPGRDAVASERLVRATWVLVRRDGGWRIASYHNSPAS